MYKRQAVAPPVCLSKLVLPCTWSVFALKASGLRYSTWGTLPEVRRVGAKHSPVLEASVVQFLTESQVVL